MASAPANIAHLCLAIVIGALGCVTAWAQAPVASSSTWAVAIDRIETLLGVDSKLTLEQVLDGQGGAFKAQQSLELEDPSWSKSFWAKVYLRPVAVSGQASALGSVLKINKPYIGEIALFSPQRADAAWQWPAQLRGLRLPPSQGAVRSQDLLFNLPSASVLADQPEAMRFVMLRVQHQLPLSFAVEALPATEALSQSYLRAWLLGMALGAIALVCVMTAALAWLNRDSTYAWYAAYAGLSWLFCVSITGFAHSMMWPVGGDWPVSAITLWGLLAAACKLHFCRKVFLRPDRDAWLHWSSLGLGIVSVLVSLGYILQNGYWTAFTLACFALIVACGFLSLVIGVWGSLQNKALRSVWLVAFLPVMLTIGYRMLEAVGWVKAHGFVFSSGIYILCGEVIIMGIAILWFARNRQGAKERLRTLASIDPLTGFASASSFRQHLRDAWQAPSDLAQDTAVVYIAVLNEIHNSQRLEHMLQRSVRVLRSATSSQDVVARLDGRLLGLLLPGASMGEQLSQRLSRIIALGLMPDSSDPKGELLQFRIAYTTRIHYRHDRAQLNQELRDLLEEKKRWGSKPIRVIDHSRSRHKMPREVIDSSGLDDKWNQALAAVNEQAAPQPSPLTTGPSLR